MDGAWFFNGAFEFMRICQSAERNLQLSGNEIYNH